MHLLNNSQWIFCESFLLYLSLRTHNWLGYFIPKCKRFYIIFFLEKEKCLSEDNISVILHSIPYNVTLIKLITMIIMIIEIVLFFYFSLFKFAIFLVLFVYSREEYQQFGFQYSNFCSGSQTKLIRFHGSSLWIFFRLFVCFYFILLMVM